MAKIIPPKELARLLRERKLVERETIVGESFRGQRWPQFGAVDSTFRDCDFSNTIIEYACFGGGRTQSHYIDCCFDSAEFWSTTPGNARFERCTFRNVKIHVFNSFDVELIDCTFSGVIKKGFFNGRPHRNHVNPSSPRDQNEFRGNDFSGARLLDVSFRTGIDLRRQKLPAGENYIYVEDGESFIKRLQSNNLLEKYGNHFNAIQRVLEEDVAAGQQQIFLSVKGFPIGQRAMLMDLKRIAEGTLLA